MTIVRYRFGDYALDLAKHELQHRGAAVALPARVFECLCFLIDQRERAVTRDELVGAVFARPDVSDAQLAQVIVRTRRAIGDDGATQHSIRTVPRFGFRWVAEVVVEEEARGVPAPASPAPEPAPVASDRDVPPTGDAGTADATSGDTGETEPARSPRAPARLAAARADPTATVSATPGRHAPLRRRWWLALPVLAVALGAGVWWSTSRPPAAVAGAVRTAAAAPAAGSVMVLPLVMEGGSDASWARLGLMDFVADRLRQAGLPVLPSETVLGVLKEHAAIGDPRRLGEVSRTHWVVASRATREGVTWSVLLEAGGRDGSALRGEGRDPDLLSAARIASDRLAAALGGDAAPGGDQPALAERLQRARAAMLANEIEAARAILMAAPELQRRQPRLRYQLARVDFRAGQYERGLEALDEVLAGADAAADPRFRAQILNARGAMLVRLGRQRDALAAYDESVALGSAPAAAAELAHALGGRGVVHSMERDFDRALADFGRARIEFGKAGDTLGIARIDANLGIVEVERGRPAHALPYLEQAATDFAAMGAVNELATLRVMRVVAYRQLLRDDLASAEAERIAALLPRVRDPAQRAELLLAQASGLAGAGRLHDAGRLLATAAAGDPPPGNPDLRARLQVELAFDAGEARRAVALADAALAAWPPDRTAAERDWVRLRREQAALRAGLPPVADAPAAAAASVPGQMLRATVLRAAGREADADAAYVVALERAEQGGVPAEIAAAVVAHASWLIERGRLEQASGLVGRVAPWAARDFELAVLHLQLMHALGRVADWEEALRTARGLAGDRPLPPALVRPPPRAS